MLPQFFRFTAFILNDAYVYNLKLLSITLIFYKYHIALFENKCLVIQVNEICAPDNSIMSWTVKHIPRIQKYEIIFFIKKSSYIFSKPLRNNDMSLFLINLMNCMKSVLMVCLMSCFEQNNWFPSHVSVNVLFI